MTMSKIERVQAALRGDPVDRPPFTFWFHYDPDRVAGWPAAEAHLATYRQYDTDLLKVMNDNGYDLPPGVEQIDSADRLAALGPAPLDSACFQNQLEALRHIRKETAGECYLVTTLFHPLNVAENLTGGRMVEFLRKDRDNALQGLGHVARSLGVFAAACLEAGADGIFMSCQDAVDVKLGDGFYVEHLAEYDRSIFAAAREGRCNVLHLHGEVCDFDAFLDFPVDAINWADRASGPAIAEVAPRMRQAILGGIDHLHTIVSGDRAALAEEIADAVRQAGEHGLIIAPGCSFPSDAPPEMMAAVGEACKAMAG